MSKTRLEVKNFWQKAGAVAICKYVNSAYVTINGNTLELKKPKKDVFNSIPDDELYTANGKPWASNIRPFIKQYPKPEGLNRFFDNVQPGKKYCSYCGRTVEKTDEDSMISNPFSVKANNFSNFYAYGYGYKTVCSDCQFLGMMAPLALFYTTSFSSNDKRITYIFPEGKTLEETLKIHNWMDSVGSKSAYSNIKLSTKFYPSQPYETLLMTLYELFKKSRMLFDATYHLIQISDQGRTTTVLVNDSFDSVKRLQNLFKKLESLGGQLNDFLDSFIYKEEGKLITEIRERLSQKILKFNDLERFIEMSIFKLDYPVKYLYEFMRSYSNQEVGL